MGEHLHEMLHVAAATLFIVAGVSALMDYRVLRERVVLSFGAMCLFSAGYACHVALAHNLPKLGGFWIPWTSAGLVITFSATFFYLLTMQHFVGVRGRLFQVPLFIQAAVTLVAVIDLSIYAIARRSFLFIPVPREGLSAHQRELGEAAYTLLPAAEVLAGLFMLSFVFGVGYMLVALVRARSRDWLLYTGLVVTSTIIANETLTALSVFGGVYLLAFSKAFETVRIHRDIRVRSRERIEHRLRQAEKMEGIGRVAGGVAHDFNNILTGIGGCIDLAALSLDEDHPAAEDLQAASACVEAGGRLVRQLLDVARSENLRPEELDMNQFLADSAKLLASLVPGPVTLQIQLEPELGAVVIPRGQLTQVLMNLVVNARDAMTEDGNIELRAAKTTAAFGLAVEDQACPAITISVADEGCGIPPEVRAHIFEPFFTTKTDRGGSGLGLATLYSIVHEAGGYIDVDSEVGRGTRFDVVLPRADSVRPKRRASTGALGRRGAPERIPVADADAEGQVLELGQGARWSPLSISTP